jgi:hypothetical protein
MLRLTHFLYSRLIDGGDVSVTRRQAALYPQEDSSYSFLSRAPQTVRLSVRFACAVLRRQVRRSVCGRIFVPVPSPLPILT